MGFYNVIYKLLAAPLRGAFRVTVTGAENLPHDRGCIVCANHTGLLDVLVISASLDRQVRYMAKKELFKIPVLSGLIRALGAYPVDRGGSDVSSIRRTVGMLREGELIGIFPQGTRHPGVDPAETEVKHGVGLIAYRAQCDIVPVYIKTKNNKTKLFRKTELIVGMPITFDELGFENGGTKEYKTAAEKIFAEICRLGKSGKGDKA